MYNAELEQIRIAKELLNESFSIKALLKVVQLLSYAA